MKRGSEREIIIYAGRSVAWHLEETALPRGRDMLIALRTSREARTCNRLLLLRRNCIARTRNPARRGGRACVGIPMCSRRLGYNIRRTREK